MQWFSVPFTVIQAAACLLGKARIGGIQAETALC